MHDQLQERYQQQPTEYLADCGFVQLDDITKFETAGCHNRGLTLFNVRGLSKVNAVTLLQAITHNIQRTLVDSINRGSLNKKEMTTHVIPNL